MNVAVEPATNEDAQKRFLIEVKLHINTKLYEKGFLTEEMYMRAKELIVKS